MFRALSTDARVNADVARDGKGGGKPDAKLAKRLYAEAMALEDDRAVA